jgi:hypothetical protein
MHELSSPPPPKLTIHAILCMCIHEFWMAFNAKNKIVNKLHFMDEISISGMSLVHPKIS